jgi:excisionase family DNA binding protein
MADEAPTLIDSRLFETTLIRFGANTMNTEPWVTASEVAQHLGVAKDTVYRWRERKGLPAHKIGRLWKFQLSEVDEWVRAGGADEETENKCAEREARHT